MRRVRHRRTLGMLELLDLIAVGRELPLEWHRFLGAMNEALERKWVSFDGGPRKGASFDWKLTPAGQRERRRLGGQVLNALGEV